MHILLRSSWQTVNIGDIAHTPGALAVFKKTLPADTIITLWPGSVDRGVAEMLKRHFPALEILPSKPDADTLRDVMTKADLLVHGSGPSVVAGDHIREWRSATSKPYGFFGITVDQPSAEHVELLNNAAFLFCRDTLSLETAHTVAPDCPRTAFGPDAAFAFDLRDEQRATAFLEANSLEKEKFLVVIPRLRFTPYHEIHHYQPNDRAKAQMEVNAIHLKHDMELLRGLCCAWVRETGKKVLLAPEMTYQMQLAREEVFDRLPVDVRSSVVVRDDYWLPDEAASVYARASGMVSLEMHSPILALGSGCPAIYVRQPTDTCKGQMWRDIGLDDWIFEIDQVLLEDLVAASLALHNAPETAQAKTKAAHDQAIATLGAAAGTLCMERSH